MTTKHAKHAKETAKSGVGENGIVMLRDRSGAVHGDRIELFFKTHEEARRWGVQERKVFIWVEPALF